MSPVFLMLLFYLLKFNPFPPATWEEKCSIHIHRLKYTVTHTQACTYAPTPTILPCNPHIWMENKQGRNKQPLLPTSSPPSHKHQPMGRTHVCAHSAGTRTPIDNMLLRPHTVINPSTSILFIYFSQMLLIP